MLQQSDYYKQAQRRNGYYVLVAVAFLLLIRQDNDSSQSMLRVGNPESSAGEYPEGDTVIIEANYKALEISYNNLLYFSLVVKISLGNVWGRLFNK